MGLGPCHLLAVPSPAGSLGAIPIDAVFLNESAPFGVQGQQLLTHTLYPPKKTPPKGVAPIWTITVRPSSGVKR